MARFKLPTLSLRARLLLLSIVLILISMGISAWLLTDLFNNYAKRQLQSELNVQMNQLLGSFNINDSGQIKLDFDLNDPRFQSPLSGLYWQIDELDDNGKYTAGVLRSRSLWDQELQLDNDNIQFTNLVELDGPGDTKLLTMVKRVAPADSFADYFLIIAIDKLKLDSSLQQFSLFVLVLLLILAVTMVVILLLQIYLISKPLSKLQLELNNVLNGNNYTISGKFPIEIQPLVNAFNNVLLLNKQMVDRARAQAGNMAHALKTPLTVISNSVQANKDDHSLLIAEQVQIAQYHINHHLALARANAISINQSEKIAIAPVINAIAGTIYKLFKSKNIVLHKTDIQDNLVFHGGQHDLEEIIGNLLENAFKWATANVWISTQFRPEKQTNKLAINIEDDGDGLDTTAQSQLFIRGVRLDEQTPGTGLGLSIVKDLVEAYGGTISTYTSSYGGLGLYLELPASMLISTHK